MRPLGREKEFLKPKNKKRIIFVFNPNDKIRFELKTLTIFM